MGDKAAEIDLMEMLVEAAEGLHCSAFTKVKLGKSNNGNNKEHLILAVQLPLPRAISRQNNIRQGSFEERQFAGSRLYQQRQHSLVQGERALQVYPLRCSQEINF